MLRVSQLVGDEGNPAEGPKEKGECHDGEPGDPVGSGADASAGVVEAVWAGVEEHGKSGGDFGWDDRSCRSGVVVDGSGGLGLGGSLRRDWNSYG